MHAKNTRAALTLNNPEGGTKERQEWKSPAHPWAHHASAVQALAGRVPSATVSFLSIAMTSPRIGCAGPVAGV